MGCAASSSAAPAPPPMPPPGVPVQPIPYVDRSKRTSRDLSDVGTGSSSSGMSTIHRPFGGSRSNSSRGSSPGRGRPGPGEQLVLDGPGNLDKDKLVAHLLGNFSAPREHTQADLQPNQPVRRNSYTELHLLPLAVLSRRRATWS